MRVGAGLINGGETRWIECDPTSVPVNDQRIVVAYGRDYGDIAPVQAWSTPQANNQTASDR